MNSVSVVIPAHNEAARILRSIRSIEQYLQKKRVTYEIIVVDDCSTDGTQEALCGEAVTVLTHAQNQGKGFAVRTGVLAARYDHILVVDADLSTPISELDQLLSITADVVIGSRALAQSTITQHQPIHREAAGKVFNGILRTLRITNFKDTQCGFKLFKRGPAHDIFARQTVKGFAFDVEVLLIAKRLGYSVAEVPVIWHNDERTTVHLFSDSLRMLSDVLRIRMHDLRGKYRATAIQKNTLR